MSVSAANIITTVIKIIPTEFHSSDLNDEVTESAIFIERVLNTESDQMSRNNLITVHWNGLVSTIMSFLRKIKDNKILNPIIDTIKSLRPFIK